MDTREQTEIRVEPAAAPERSEHGRVERASHEPDTPAAMQVRDDDLEPHAGLRYIARLFKVLALLLLVLMIGEVVIGFMRQGAAAIPALLVEVPRLIVFAGLLWGAADLALMLIESNHDLRATRILVGRLNGRLKRMEEASGAAAAAPSDSAGAARTAATRPDLAP
ncbi:MAG: hypothetical protein M3409_12465 [Gemmatimonadota bacterium]|nr:hypothetical protein [Gemmatimonadota bacterium]